MTYCSGGVANEYCQHLADANAIKLTQKSLVYMTQSELDDLVAAGKNGLWGFFLKDDYIYLVDSNGSDRSFHGLYGTINSGINVPYQVCLEHTREDWENYLKAHPEAESNE